MPTVGYFIIARINPGSQNQAENALPCLLAISSGSAKSCPVIPLSRFGHLEPALIALDQAGGLFRQQAGQHQLASRADERSQ